MKTMRMFHSEMAWDRGSGSLVAPFGRDPKGSKGSKGCFGRSPRIWQIDINRLIYKICQFPPDALNIPSIPSIPSGPPIPWAVDDGGGERPLWGYDPVADSAVQRLFWSALGVAPLDRQLASGAI